MAIVAVVVRGKAVRDRHGDAAIDRSVARGAAGGGTRCARVVNVVIKLHVEAPQTREARQSRILHAQTLIQFRRIVADHAHRNVLLDELREVTIGAGFVSRKTRLGILIAAMARRTSGRIGHKRAMLARVVVREVGEFCSALR